MNSFVKNPSVNMGCGSEVSKRYCKIDPYNILGKVDWIKGTGAYSTVVKVSWLSAGKKELEYASGALKRFRSPSDDPCSGLVCTRVTSGSRNSPKTGFTCNDYDNSQSTQGRTLELSNQAFNMTTIHSSAKFATCLDIQHAPVSSKLSSAIVESSNDVDYSYDGSSSKAPNLRYLHLDLFEASALEIPFSPQEIKFAIWDYDSFKAPGPDGANFHFFYRSMAAPQRRDLSYTRVSILVNGRPTSEFNLLNGLRQGDLLPPFLFIIAIKPLSLLIQEACLRGSVEGVSIGSGDEDFLNSAASIACCKVGSYLGFPLGANVKQKATWTPVLKKIDNKLNF
ncbi:hypothetical protein GH714_035220 [Hevea brasiliensis]|uniref:Reverse transcriptase domain-containing protein n=1 Tax=Hevea brasiliensis TaxID=3981 RepID=A0A6A6KDP6_HEVBR|nr:hypothetical protein GH714_035220 [Hevea brasiliensis]